MEIGDRVKCSQRWLNACQGGARRYSNSLRRGVVTGFSRDGHCVKVRWDRNISSSGYWTSFIELDQEIKNNYQIY